MVVNRSVMTDSKKALFGEDDAPFDRVVLIEERAPSIPAAVSSLSSARFTDFLSEKGTYLHENALLRLEFSFRPYTVFTQFHRPLPPAWSQLNEFLQAAAGVRGLRLYEQPEGPAAAIWYADGSLKLLGVNSGFGGICWQNITHMYWEAEGFAGIDTNGTIHSAGSLLPMNGEKACRLLCAENRGAFTAVGGLQRPDGSVWMLNRFRRQCEPLGERMEKIQVLQVPTTGRCIWVGLACHTHRFLTSEAGGTLSADHFGGPYTEHIDPNRYHQKIKDFIALPRHWLAVLYQNGFLRIFGKDFAPGEILCEGVSAIEREGNALVALLPRDLSRAPMLEEPQEELQRESPALTLGEAADPAEYGASIEKKLRELLENPLPESAPLQIKAAQRTADQLYLAHKDGRITVQPMRGGETALLPRSSSGLPPVRRIYPSCHGYFVLCEDHTLLGFSPEGQEIFRWENIKDFTHSWSLAAALTRGGHALVYPFPKNNDGRLKEHFCNGHITLLAESEEWDFSEASDWHSLRALAAGEDVLYGLTEDGKILSIGNEENGQRRVEDWRDIIQLACLDHVVFGLRKDGTLLSAGQSFFANYAVSEWTDIAEILPFQNSMASLLAGRRRDGALMVAGRWSMDTYAYDNKFPIADWHSLELLQSDGYYLTARTTEGRLLHQSTPAPDGGCEPAEEHTFYWEDVCQLLCREGWMLLRHRDGTVSWEGKKRPAAQKAVTDRWQGVKHCLLWRIAPRQCYAVAVTHDEALLTDAVACADPTEASLFATWLQELTSVQRLDELEQYLVVLHSMGLTLLGWENGTLRRHDFPGVCRFKIFDNSKTLCMEYPDKRLLCIGRTVYDSRAATMATEIRRIMKGGITVGLIGLRQGGIPFLMTEENDSLLDSRWYSLPELLRLLRTQNAVKITAEGTLLLQAGRCIARGSNPLHRWNGIRQLAQCSTHTVGITAYGTMLLYGTGEEGRSLEEYTGVQQVICLPYTTLFLRQDGRLFLLCTRYANMPCHPLPVSREIADIAITSSHLAILTRNGVLWCASPLEQNPGCWGPWEKHSKGVSAIRVQNDSLAVWRQDSAHLLLAPTITTEQFSGMEPTIPEE